MRRIRKYLSADTAIMLANVLVSSRVDYCNSLFHSLTARNMKKLQSIQNNLSRVITGASRFSHITPSLKSLHWLPVKQYCMFKTAVVVYKYI